MVPQPYADPVAVHDLGDGGREALGDLLARPRLRQGVGEREQRAHLFVALRGLLQRRGHVEHGGGVLGVQAEQLSFLREERDRAGIARDQLPVVAPARGDLDDQRRVAVGRVVGERRVREQLVPCARSMPWL